MREPRILVVDIETSPNVGLFWSSGHKIAVGPENILEERQVICIAFKWLGHKSTHSLVWDYKKGNKRDKQMLAEFSKVYAAADAVVAHNGDNFDIKWLKTRILYHKLPPLAETTQIDTLKEYRKNFKFNSNRLDYVAKFLGQEGKNPMSFEDWKLVMKGNAAATRKMVKYCKKDVELLADLYERTRPYLKDHGIMRGFLGDRDVCPNCGGSNNIKHGDRVTKTGRYQRYQCQDCSHVWKDTRQKK